MVGDKSKSQMISLPDDVTYILGGLTMEGTLAGGEHPVVVDGQFTGNITANEIILREKGNITGTLKANIVLISGRFNGCLLYTSPSPRDAHESRMPSSA